MQKQARAKKIYLTPKKIRLRARAAGKDRIRNGNICPARSVDSNEPCKNAARMVLSTDNGYIVARVA
jgi:hypothetical protein